MGSHSAESQPIRRRDLRETSPDAGPRRRAAKKVVSPRRSIIKTGPILAADVTVTAEMATEGPITESLGRHTDPEPAEPAIDLAEAVGLAGAANGRTTDEVAPVSAQKILERSHAVPTRRRTRRGRVAAISSLAGAVALGTALAVVLVSGPFTAETADASASLQSGTSLLSPEKVSGGQGAAQDAKSPHDGDTVKSQESHNLIGGVPKPEDRSKADEASRSISRSVLPGCSGKKPEGTAENGELPDSWLCSIGIGQHKLRADAAVGFATMNAAFKADTGKDMVITDSYRSLASQISVRARKPGLAAQPGTSQHGWGLALDFGGGAATASGQQYDWLVKNGPKFGWENPEWAKTSKYEPWHWEYIPGGGRSDAASE